MIEINHGLSQEFSIPNQIIKKIDYHLTTEYVIMDFGC